MRFGLENISCNFNDVDVPRLCGWEQAIEDDADWTLTNRRAHSVRIWWVSKRKRQMSSELFGTYNSTCVRGAQWVSLVWPYSLPPIKRATQHSPVLQTIPYTQWKEPKSTDDICYVILDIIALWPLSHISLYLCLCKITPITLNWTISRSFIQIQIIFAKSASYKL